MSKLLDYLPGYYKTSTVISSLTDSEDIELALFRTKLDSTLNQFFVDLADSSLDRWEKELGLEVNTSYTTTYRRSRIKARLRGQGTITVTLIKNVSESCSNGEVDVIEDSAAYNFTVKFVGTMGVPPNLTDLQKAIEDIKPAHLAYSFEYSWITWDQFDNYNKTWDEWDALNLTWDEFETYKEVV